MIKIATIAGSDASGGAGLEADLKTFEEYGLYGMAAVTVIAAMDPDADWAHSVFPIEENCLRSQMETVFKGAGVAAAKSGMLGSFYAVDLTAEYIKAYGVKNYILDPVMVCKGAKEALNPELNAAIAEKLLPLAEVVTPNLFEAEQLSGLDEIASIDRMKEAAKIIYDKGPRGVFIKGGAKLVSLAPVSREAHPKAVDIFYDGGGFELFEAELVQTKWNHGAGCTVSAAIAAGLARGLPARDALALAKKFITASLKAGFPLNQWVGPGNPAVWRAAFE
ncbi:MAG: bifunctional hydroxymethylpyrimidine kinase/phosphomethylpyrimidine kinase [Spirochaetaceae bacterium]|nr:bifunctional hydroxymethylpyrimidine kinase/phosphomethylpyrimidine kinase [Spirochaetaceae bacterium]